MEMDYKKRVFENVYQNEVDRIFRFVFMRVSSREEAIDITEEVFYKLWQQMTEGEDIENPLAFLFAIARNKIIDWYRKKKSLSLESILSKDEDDETELQIVDPEAQTEINISTEASWIIKALKEMDRKDAEIIELRFLQGLQPQEISQILNTSANSVSIRITRALEKLREKLGINLEKNEY